MKKKTVPRNTRLVPQRPVKKARFFSRGQPKNIYRRNLFGGGKKPGLRLVLLSLGFLGLAGLCLGLVFFYHQLLTCSLFCIKDIRNIEIEGTHRLTPEVVLHLAKLSPDTTLLAVRPGQVRRTLLAPPWIARAELTRKC